MDDTVPGAGEGRKAVTAAYGYVPRPTAGPISLKLSGDRLEVDNGRKAMRVQLRAVQSVRMTYEPRSVGRNAYKTRVRLVDGTSFAFSSLSYKSFVETERQDAAYRAFVASLFAAIARAGPNARFVAGRPPLVWGTIAALSFASLAAMAFFVWRALNAGAPVAAAMGAVFLALAAWQLEPMVRLNRPRAFRPEAPPPDLLP